MGLQRRPAELNLDIVEVEVEMIIRASARVVVWDRMTHMGPPDKLAELLEGQDMVLKELLEAWAKMIPMEIVDKVEVLAPAKTLNMVWAPDELAPKSKEAMAQEVVTPAMMTVATKAAKAVKAVRIPQAASSCRRLAPCSAIRVWSRRAARSVNRLVMVAMITAAITKEGSCGLPHC